MKYENLVIGAEYTLKGTLMNQVTGEALLDADGNAITAEATFVANINGDMFNTVESVNTETHSVSGSYELVFTLDSSLLAGKTAVVFEDLEHNDVRVATHSDLTDESQSVHYPEIHTMAVDSRTGDHVGSIYGDGINGTRALFGEEDADDQKIIDTVALYNLVPGYTYVVTGKLYDSETGEPVAVDGVQATAGTTIVVSEDGQTITAADGAETSVTGHGSGVDGTVALTFELDSSKLMGRKVVAFEDLYHDATYTPDIKPEDVDEKDIIHRHEDINDEDQSVSEVSIHTTAVDSATKDHVGSVPNGSEPVTIEDRVELEGLVPGMSYTIEGALADVDATIAARKPIYLKADGTTTEDRSEAVVETLTFEADAEEDDRVLEFVLNGDKFLGKTITVFEDLYHNEVKIATHPTIADSDLDTESISAETVYYPAGKTNAVDAATGLHASTTDETRVINDSVYFENLLVGQKYTIDGQLVYQSSFTDAKGVEHKAGEAVEGATASVTFTVAESMDNVENLVVKTVAGNKVASGYITLTFEVDTSALAGATLVAFEDFSHNGVKIFTHNDLSDLPQTIRIPKISTSAKSLDLDEASVRNEDGSFRDITITDTVTYKNLWTKAELEEMAEQGKRIRYRDGSFREQDSNIYTINESTSYVLKGVLMDKATGKALEDNTGKTFTVYSEPFVPETHDGAYDMTFTLNASAFVVENESNLENRIAVVFEDLYLADTVEKATDDNLIVEHHDIDDVEQDIRFPAIRTHAQDGATSLTVDEHDDEAASSTHESAASSSMTITDTVSYTNLHGGTTYTVKGTLQVLTENGYEAAKDDSGKPITATKELRTEGAYNDSVSGSVDLVFKFSGTTLAGKTVVAFETLEREGVMIAVHADINDEAQTVYIPNLHTNASEALSGLSDALAGSGTVIIDKVSYENLEAGKTYVLKATMHRKSDGRVVDGSEVIGTFVAGVDGQMILKDGTRIMTADELKSYVEASAKKASESESSGSQMDPGDKAEYVVGKDIQAGYYKVTPGTSSSGTVSGYWAIFYKADGTVPQILNTDTILKNGNLSAGQEAYIRVENNMVLQVTTWCNTKVVRVDDTVGKANLDVALKAFYQQYDAGNVPGKDADNTVDKITVPVENITVVRKTDKVDNRVSGEVSVVIPVDTTSLAGETIVAFETLYAPTADDWKVVGSHEDITDEDQSVNIPKIGTNATINGEKQAAASDKMTVTDTVSYSNLTPGVEYTMRGVLMDKATGKSIEVKAESTFKPSEANGTMTMTFTFDGSKLSGRQLVVFEQLIRKGADGSDYLIAKHEDINDAAQTVTIETPGKTPGGTTPGVDTGDIGTTSMIAGGAAMLVLLAVLFIIRRRKMMQG